MSVVTNIMISGHFHKESEIITSLQKFTDPGIPFQKVDNRKVGGTKALEGDLLIGAFDSDKNYSLLVEIIKGFKQYDDRDYSHCIQVFTKREDDDYWKIYTPEDINLLAFTDYENI